MRPALLFAFIACVWASVAGAADLGRVPVIWQDEARDRQIVAWVYYPAARKSGPPELVMPPAFSPSYEAELGRRWGPNTGKIRAAATTEAVSEAPIADGAHPVLLFVPGAGFLPADYNILIEAMAARGYVVIAISPRPTRRLDYTGLSGDIAFVAQQIAHVALPSANITPANFDTKRIAAFGHSVGGASSVLAATREPLIKAALNFDGDFAGPSEAARPTSPLLYVTSEPGPAGYFGNSEVRRKRVWQALSVNAIGSRSLRIAHTQHLDFLDVSLLKHRMSLDKRQHRFGSIEPKRGLDITIALTAAFFDETLNAKKGALDAALAQLPEVKPVFEPSK